MNKLLQGSLSLLFFSRLTHFLMKMFYFLSRYNLAAKIIWNVNLLRRYLRSNFTVASLLMLVMLSLAWSHYLYSHSQTFLLIHLIIIDLQIVFFNISINTKQVIQINKVFLNYPLWGLVFKLWSLLNNSCFKQWISLLTLDSTSFQK